jgi:hypothetical protein
MPVTTRAPPSKKRPESDITAVESPRSRRLVAARRAFESRHSLTWLYEHRVEVIAATALPFNLHGQLGDRWGFFCYPLIN